MKKTRIPLAMLAALALLTVPASGEEIRARVVDGPGVNVLEPAPAPSALGAAADDRALSAELWGGIGAMGGDVTYQIGGAYVDANGPGRYNFPLSELRWPLNVLTATVGGNINIAKYVEILGTWSGNLDSDAGLMEDSDWTDPARPWVRTTYSTSETDFDGMTADLGLRCWVLNWVWDRQTGYSFGIGGGWLYQDFRWDARNVDQWYPADPQMGHDFQYGLVATYKTRVNMPYIEIAGEMRMAWLSFLGSLGYSPETRVTDEDDHKVRSILAKTDADGDAVKLSLVGRYDFNYFMFGTIRADFIAYDVDGVENDYVYGGDQAGSTWSIHHEITSAQENITVALGMKF